MATTLSDIQTSIALDFDQASTAPDTTTDDYARRKLLINRSEKKWKNALNGRWDSLRTTATLSITGGTSYVALPTDFTPNGLVVAKGGQVLLNGSYAPIVKFQDVPSYTSSDLLCYITGDDANGYRLNFQPTPTSSSTLDITYYSKYIAQTSGGTGLEKLTSGTDYTKCPDSDFIVLDVVAQLLKSDGEANLGQDYQSQANDLLNQMIAQNNAGNIGVPNEIQTYNDLNSYPNIGE